MLLKSLLVTTFSLGTALGLFFFHHHDAEVERTRVEEEKEISPYMGELQRFSQKFGYATSAGNQALMEFYGEEIGEVLGELKEIDEHDGFPIARTIKVIMDPIMKDLDEAIEKQDMKAAKEQYLTMIEGCNRCHASTEHEYIEILPASGTPPFNQKF